MYPFTQTHEGFPFEFWHCPLFWHGLILHGSVFENGAVPVTDIKRKFNHFEIKNKLYLPFDGEDAFWQ